MSTTTLKELIKDVRVAMLVTLDEENMLRSRPLATLEVDDEKELHFFTRIDAPKVDEIAHERQVNLSYSDPKAQRFVSVSGVASVSRDRSLIERYWKPIHRAWFPDGVDDPQLSLLQVKVEKAEYWDVPSSSVVQAFGLAKALITGTTYTPGKNEKLRVAGKA